LAAFVFSFVHLGAMLVVRTMFWADAGKAPSVPYSTFVQRMYLTNLDWLLMTYAAIVGMSYALAFNRESQGRAIKAVQLETRLVEARLQTLQAELHPHFLFNTLHAISTLIHSKPDAADRMISRLSDLLRLTFDRSGAAGVSFQEELEFLQKYLEIEQTRFQDRLSVRFDIAPDALDAEVPRLILQPLVENAIKHGVSPRSGPGLVQIAAQRQGDALWLEVRDDGVGLTTAARSRLNAGVGLSNTRDRLECLYGARHRLDFSEGANGLAVRIEIPFHSAPSGTDAAAPRVA
jgi:two-component system, LytTR family, sensor kinase